jgi:hypothetical protein
MMMSNINIETEHGNLLIKCRVDPEIYIIAVVAALVKKVNQIKESIL